jgi:hypothetical protein
MRVNYAAHRCTAHKRASGTTERKGERAVSATFTIAYARREQEAEVPKARGLARVKSILAATTRQDWEADGPRLWVRKGDPELRIVDLTDDDGRVELEEGSSKKGGPGA